MIIVRSHSVFVLLHGLATMAALVPACPDIRRTTNRAFYQSLNSIDEQIYNGLRYQYERAAFLDVIINWRQ